MMGKDTRNRRDGHRPVSAEGRGGVCRAVLLVLLLVVIGMQSMHAHAQRVSTNDAIHRRGQLWYDIWNDGFIGNGCAWDYCTTATLGMYPGFDGATHPIGGESNAINTFANANSH